MLIRNPAFMGQVRLMPPTFPPPMPPAGGFPSPSPYAPPSGGVCPAGKVALLNLVGKTVCVDSPHYAVAAGGTTPATPPKPPPTQEPEFPPYDYPLEEPGRPPVPSEDLRNWQPEPDWLRIPTDVVGPMESEEPPQSYSPPVLPGAEQAAGLPCPPGQERPPGGGWCAPKPVATGYGGGRPGGFGGFGGYGGAINMAPSGTSFTMAGRAMLGQVRLRKRSVLGQEQPTYADMMQGLMLAIQEGDQGMEQYYRNLLKEWWNNPPPDSGLTYHPEDPSVADEEMERYQQHLQEEYPGGLLMKQEPPSVPSTDDLYPYGTGMAPQGENGCPPGQYRPTWSIRCVPKGGGGFSNYGGIVNMAPTAAVPFSMGRTMLGRVRLARRPY